MKKLLLPLAIVLILASCSTEEEPGPKLNEYQLSVIEYFKEVALGFEFGTTTQITRKWPQSMDVFIGGSPDAVHLTELNTIIGEINDLATDGFSVQIVEDSMLSNYYVYFGTGDEYAAIFPNIADYVSSNWGLFFLWWNGNNNFTKGHMYVDTERPDLEAQRHLLREEFTQSLGLAKDSPRYSDSIFQSSWTTTTSYSAIDADLIRLLYHPEMSVGLGANEVEAVLTEILLNE